MIEKPADNVRGFLLYCPFSKRHWFRVYGEIDPETGHKSFTDYKLCAEDIEVTIHAGGLSLYEPEPEKVPGVFSEGVENKLDWSSATLGKDLVSKGDFMYVPCKDCKEPIKFKIFNKPLVVSTVCPNGHRNRVEVPAYTS